MRLEADKFVKKLQSEGQSEERVFCSFKRALSKKCDRGRVEVWEVWSCKNDQDNREPDD